MSNLNRELIQKVEYPSGLRGWIANPLFVGSNPTSTSTKYEVMNFFKKLLVWIWVIIIALPIAISRWLLELYWIEELKWKQKRK